MPQEMAPSRIGQFPCRPEVTKCANTLIDELVIGYQRDRPKLHRCFVLLKSQDLFTRLVDIYTTLFKIHGRSFKHVIESYDLPDDRNCKVKVAAEAYVSCWFWDLYVSIQQSVWKLSFTARAQQYQHRMPFSADRYDPFLQHLNAVIRPTHTTQSLRDTLWIPVIRENINWEDDNPFNLDGWLQREDQVCALHDVMDENTNDWRTVPLSPDTPGNPMWLLDWCQNQAYCWFPKEGHFTNEDLVAAYVLGIPLTPHLGPSDPGDWQTFPDNVMMPANVVWSDLPRVTPRNFHGSAEFRTYDSRTHDTLLASVTVSETLPPPPLPRKEGDSTCHIGVTRVPVEGTRPEADPAQPERTELLQYRVTDWCYHAKVIFNLYEDIQYQALRAFLFSDGMLV